MATIHQAPGVNETARNAVVPASAPAVGHQATRAAAAAVVVPFAYASGRAGGP